MLLFLQVLRVQEIKSERGYSTGKSTSALCAARYCPHTRHSMGTEKTPATSAASATGDVVSPQGIAVVQTRKEQTQKG
jgi:hypothetical protein